MNKKEWVSQNCRFANWSEEDSRRRRMEDWQAIRSQEAVQLHRNKPDAWMLGVENLFPIQNARQWLASAEQAIQAKDLARAKEEVVGAMLLLKSFAEKLEAMTEQQQPPPQSPQTPV